MRSFHSHPDYLVAVSWQILPILYSHKPVDVVGVMLGVNDCKQRFHPSANKIANSMEQLLRQCLQAEIWPVQQKEIAHGPQIVLISPPSIRTLTAMNREWGWDQSSIHVSQSLHSFYQVSTQCMAPSLDATNLFDRTSRQSTTQCIL